MHKKEFEDLKGVFRIHKSRKDRQHHVQKKKDKRTNNDLQNITHKTKYRLTRTPLKTGGQLMCSGGVSSSCSTSGTRRLICCVNNLLLKIRYSHLLSILSVVY